MIANACGIRAPSIYEHFANKRELLFAAMTDVLGDFRRSSSRSSMRISNQANSFIDSSGATQRGNFASRTCGCVGLAGGQSHRGTHLLPEEVTEFTRQRRLYLDVVTSLTAAAFPSPQPHIRARAVLSLCDQIMSWSGPSVPSDEPRLLDHVWVLARAILTSALAADVNVTARQILRHQYISINIGMRRAIA